MTMTDIKSMTQEEITDALRAMGEPAFRGKQVFSWLHKGATDFAEMNNLSKPLREKLGKEFTITAPTVARKQVSRLDGTVKYLWELRDGNCIDELSPRQYRLHLLAGRLPDGLQILRLHHSWQGKRLNTFGDA